MARLSHAEITAIKTSVSEVLGESCPYELWLFGSRADDTLRGGDIDLFVETTADIPSRVQAICHIYAKIILRLGDRKIDVLLKDCKTENAAIFDIAKRTGVRL
jgi:predicted nucleotidyltransferase